MYITDLTKKSLYIEGLLIVWDRTKQEALQNNARPVRNKLQTPTVDLQLAPK